MSFVFERNILLGLIPSENILQIGLDSFQPLRENSKGSFLAELKQNSRISFKFDEKLKKENAYLGLASCSEKNRLMISKETPRNVPRDRTHDSTKQGLIVCFDLTDENSSRVG